MTKPRRRMRNIIRYHKNTRMVRWIKKEREACRQMLEILSCTELGVLTITPDGIGVAEGYRELVAAQVNVLANGQLFGHPTIN